ncbi:DUF192 domain-containing protein [Meiothermus granaticius]|uniref:DUF192 domain-containing protein n=1 Tax=Meiothermus granaticius NBRC 107808 TaxID=1227551 RepID=A0A399F4Q0_9DEIN|nr:DUF192 domain-containing protein [Meiothermus granaticius]RIH91030.1 hypothetical protein Mgrana_03077 [Meiothermus granaticius NBRC 107808]GEM85932.1 hypothetical protein MGR01S_05570 [Meiothermus granaticius NBRC 107808]
MKSYALGLVALLVAVATAGYFYAGRTLNAPPPTLPKRTVSIESAGHVLRLPVGLVLTPRQWFVSHRGDLLQVEGLFHQFPEVRDSPWNTAGFRYAVSVAFLDGNGSILKIMDMEPCSSPSPRTCPEYAPEVAYRMALEVRKGWFTQHKVRPGDVVRLENR